MTCHGRASPFAIGKSPIGMDYILVHCALAAVCCAFHARKELIVDNVYIVRMKRAQLSAMERRANP